MHVEMHDKPSVPVPPLIDVCREWWCAWLLGRETRTASLPYPPGGEIHVYSYLFLLMLYYCRHTTAYLLVLALMFKIMADQIVDFACVGGLDNKCCVTGPLSVEYRSSHLNHARWSKSMGIMKLLFLLISQIVAGVYWIHWQQITDQHAVDLKVHGTECNLWRVTNSTQSLFTSATLPQRIWYPLNSISTFLSFWITHYPSITVPLHVKSYILYSSKTIEWVSRLATSSWNLMGKSWGPVSGWGIVNLLEWAIRSSSLSYL